MREYISLAIWHHEMVCAQTGDSFKVRELYELAPGVVATLDDDGEYTLYFDQSISFLSKAPLSDTSAEMGGMTDGVGVIECVTADNLEQITAAAKLCLDITTWHDTPVALPYPPVPN